MSSCALQLAKCKADELEDFAVGQHPEPQHSDEVTEEGIQIVEELLRTWVESTSGTDGGDLAMDDELSTDTQLEELRRCRGVPTTHKRQCLGAADDTLFVIVVSVHGRIWHFPVVF